MNMKLSLAVCMALIATILHAEDFDYKGRWKSFYIVGILGGQRDCPCGIATKQHITDPGHISLYQHDYYLEEMPHVEII
jgi:hypothetical protein